MHWRSLFPIVVSASYLAACQAPVETEELPDDEEVASTEQAICDHDDLDVEASVFAQVDPPIPGGIAAAKKVVFYGSPLDGRVVVLSRDTGSVIAELPQPPGNFILPLVMHEIEENRLAVLDTGGFPDPGITDAQPTIYEYEYSYSNGNFQASLARTVSFAGKKIGYAEEFVYLGNGKYLVPDAVYGSIWQVKQNGSVIPGIVPKTFNAADAIPEMVYCTTMPQVTVGGLPFLFTGSTIPGVAGIAKRNNKVYFYSSCAKSLFKFPYSILNDNRQPWQRAQDIDLIASAEPGVEVEEILEMQFNPYDPSDKYLYATDALQLRVIRIDPQDGEREILADDPDLFSFPSGLAFLPPKHNHDRKTKFLVMSNQQHRDPILNSALNGVDYTEIPYTIAKVVVDD